MYVGLRDLLGFFHNPSEAMIQRAIAIGEASTGKCMGRAGCAGCCLGSGLVSVSCLSLRKICLLAAIVAMTSTHWRVLHLKMCGLDGCAGCCLGSSRLLPPALCLLHHPYRTPRVQRSRSQQLESIAMISKTF